MSSSPVATSRLARGDGGDAQAAVDRRKANGAYYTPPRLAKVLAGWALERAPARVLEPSYGDGVFLRAAYERLMAAGVPDPSARLTGVEIDPKGKQRIQEHGPRIHPSQLHRADLLELDPQRLGGRFGAILGNPPYIRHHLLSENLVRCGRASAKRLGIELNGRSDAWAYFCAHLVTFLDEDGRLALVLPGSALHADYAEPLLAAFASGCGQTQLIRVKERLFDGVQERTVVLLMDRGAEGGEVIFRQVASVPALGQALKRRPRRHGPATRGVADGRGGAAGATVPKRRRDHARLPWRLTKAEAAVFASICEHADVFPLGELVTVRIGVVTGANSFFIRSRSEVSALGAGARSKPIVSRGAWLRKPRWTSADQARVGNEPSRLLLIEAGGKLSPMLWGEIEQAEEGGIHDRSHCTRREPWYAIDDTAAPHFFLPYMGARPPRIVVNETRATCTNAIHRLRRRRGVELEAGSLTLGSWTSLYRLSAELAGRSYGGGVLKLEPRGACELRLPIVDLPGLLEELEEVAEKRDAETASGLADRRILVEGLGLSRKEVSILAGAAERLHELRHR